MRKATCIGLLITALATCSVGILLLLEGYLKPKAEQSGLESITIASERRSTDTSSSRRGTEIAISTRDQGSSKPEAIPASVQAIVVREDGFGYRERCEKVHLLSAPLTTHEVAAFYWYLRQAAHSSLEDRAEENWLRN